MSRQRRTGFERRRVELEPMSELATRPGEWAGAIVLVETGVVETVCASGGRGVFVAGDLLALDWLAVCLLRNPTPVVARLLAIRRRDGPATPVGIASPGAQRGGG